MKNLENYGVQELNIIETQSVIGGGNPLKDYVIGKLVEWAVGAVADGAEWVWNNQPEGYINTHQL